MPCPAYSFFANWLLACWSNGAACTASAGALGDLLFSPERPRLPQIAFGAQDRPRVKFRILSRQAGRWGSLSSVRPGLPLTARPRPSTCVTCASKAPGKGTRRCWGRVEGLGQGGGLSPRTQQSRLDCCTCYARYKAQAAEQLSRSGRGLLPLTTVIAPG